MSEPSEKTATRALSGNRQLVKSFQPLIGQWDPLSSSYNLNEVSQTWIKDGPNTHYQETYFDTSGYTRDMLTIYPLTAYVQEAGRYQLNFPGTQRVMIVDLIMTERILDLATFSNDLLLNNQMVGFPNTTYDFTQIIFGRFREFTGITQGGNVQDVFAPVNDQQFGSLEPTTADKLWIYKIIVNVGLPSSPELTPSIRLPSSRIVLQIDVQKEKELPFMMRQKRSYELTNY